jgi:two-component system, NarL family, sensor histidine kinase UhpB
MNSLPGSYNILIVEDNPADLFLLEDMLMSCRLVIDHIHTVSRLQEAKELLQQVHVDCILLDLSLPDCFGIDTLESLRKTTQYIPIIILTGLADSDVALMALNCDAQDYLVKGEFNTNLLVKSIEYSFERKKIEERIRLSEEKYRLMFYKNPFPMWVNDEHSLQILEVNDAAIQTYGYSREEFLKLTLRDIFVGPELTVSPASPDCIGEKRCEHKKKNGDIIIVDFTYFGINYLNTTAMQAQVVDITEKVLLEQELNLQKQKMLEAVLNAQETERQVIGRELHDNINQVLTAIKLNLDFALEKKVNNEIFITNSLKHIKTVMQEVRKLSKELIIPGNIKELGIVNSIEDLLKEMLELKGIKWSFSAEGFGDKTIREDHKLNIYRIIQEQLTNIVKHAEASFIDIQMTISGEKIYLKIIDNGKGFDPGMKREGVGITNMISRAELFDGEVKIDSVPGEGCVLEVVLNVGKSEKSEHMNQTPINILWKEC